MDMIFIHILYLCVLLNCFENKSRATFCPLWVIHHPADLFIHSFKSQQCSAVLCCSPQSIDLDSGGQSMKVR